MIKAQEVCVQRNNQMRSAITVRAHAMTRVRVFGSLLSSSVFSSASDGVLRESDGLSLFSPDTVANSRQLEENFGARACSSVIIAYRTRFVLLVV